MPFFIGETDDLVLDARAVPGPYPLDDTGEKGRAVEVFPDNPFGFPVCVGDMAEYLVLPRRLGGIAEGRNGVVAGLGLEPGKVYRTAVYPRGGAGLEPANRQAQFLDGGGQRRGGEGAVGTAFIRHVAYIDAAAQECTRCKYDGSGIVAGAQAGDGLPAGGGLRPIGQAGDIPTLFYAQGAQGDYLSLAKFQVLLLFQGGLHVTAVSPSVDLRAQAVNRGTLPPVEHPALDKSGIGRFAHLAPQRVDLPYQVALGRTADRGVTGQISYPVHIDGENGGSAAQPGRCQSRLYPRVPRADDQNIVYASKVAHFYHIQTYYKSIYYTIGIFRFPDNRIYRNDPSIDLLALHWLEKEIFKLPNV